MKEKNTITIFHLFWLIVSLYLSIKGFTYGQNTLNSLIGGILGMVAGLIVAYLIGWIIPFFIIHRILKTKNKVEP